MKVLLTDLSGLIDNDGHPTNLEIDINWNGQENMCNDFDFIILFPLIVIFQ